jgi:hypothetical protein
MREKAGEREEKAKEHLKEVRGEKRAKAERK